MMNTNISVPVSSGGADAHAEKGQGQVSPPIREVWDALTHPLFLLDPVAAHAYDGFMCRLRAVIENGEEGIVWAMTVLETANRIMDNTMLKQAVLARYQEQRSYIRRNAANIAAFAKARYALLGRGIVIIDWPSSGFPLPEDIQDGIEYMTEEAWRSGGDPMPGEDPQSEEEFESGERILRALGQYDPSRQAVVIFSDIENTAAYAYVPTFIFESPDTDG
jgi:hypothetical protein